MSRFFARGQDYDSSSSSEEDLLTSSEDELLSSFTSEDSDDSFFNDSESELEESGDDSDSKPYGPDWFKKPEFRKGGSSNKFLKKANYSDSEESDEEGKKVVKSAKDKLLDEMGNIYTRISAAELSQNWITIQNEFENISKLLVKAQQQNFGIPNIFVKVLVQVEDAVTATSQSEIVNKTVAKAFNTVKQRVRKAVRDNDALLKKFRANPESFDKELIADVEAVQVMVNNQFSLLGKNADMSVATGSSQSDFFSALHIAIDSRGKKNTDRHAQIKTMEELAEIAQTPYESIMAYLNLIPIRFDACASLSYQPLDQWRCAFKDIMKLLDILEINIDTYHVSEIAPKNEFIENEPQPNAAGIKEVLGSIFSFVERLDDEFNKSLLHIDPHSSDYLDRLKDEQFIYNLILRSQLYLEHVLPEDELNKYLARVFSRRLDHIYYKSSELIEIIETNAWSAVSPGYKSKYITLESTADAKYVTLLIDTLCTAFLAQSNVGLRRRATLYQIYHYALHNEFSKAMDMLLASNIQSSINLSDPSLQILFNRVVVQLGLTAFKLCLIDDCHQILNEVSTSSHLRDILGQQSLQRASNNSNVTTTTSTVQICLPFHQHINLDLIDVVFMTCSLLIEIPHMAAFFSGIKVKRIPFSQKSIRRTLEHYEKSGFQGPPETLRDHVLYAAKAMQKGDWLQSASYLKAIPTWSLLSGYEDVLLKLTEKVQIESLKTYIFTYKRFYSKLSIDRLSQLFDLSQSRVISIIESIIIEYDIKGKLDDKKTMVIFDKGDEITKLEEVTIKLSKETKYQSDRLNSVTQR